MRPIEKLNLLDQSFIQSCLDRVGYDVDENGCHIWRGTKSTQGYGRAYMGRIRVNAQRAAWVAKNGPMDIKADACHKCDVRACMNADHIFPGSRQENMRDAAAKRRLHAFTSPETMPRGEMHGASKIKIDDAFSIWLSLESSDAIAMRFGINQTTVDRIKSGRLWRLPIQDYAREQFHSLIQAEREEERK